MPTTIAEIFGVLYGLNLCWTKGCQRVIVKSDSLEAINLVLRGCNVEHPFYDLIVDTRIAMYRKWQVRYVHINRDRNGRADFLARHAHTLDSNFCIWDQTPPWLGKAVADPLDSD